MQGVLRGIGWFFTAAAAVLIFLGVLSWPPGGLLFALPYFFLIPGVVFAVVGGLLLLLGRRRGPDGSGTE
jgi:hypothetical protein